MSKPKTMAGRKMVSLPPFLWEKVADYRFGRRINTESQAIRELLTYGLAHLAAAEDMKDLRQLLDRIAGQLSFDDAKALQSLLGNLNHIEGMAEDALMDDSQKPRLPGF